MLRAGSWVWRAHTGRDTTAPGWEQGWQRQRWSSQEPCPENSLCSILPLVNYLDCLFLFAHSIEKKKSYSVTVDWIFWSLVIFVLLGCLIFMIVTVCGSVCADTSLYFNMLYNYLLIDFFSLFAEFIFSLLWAGIMKVFTSNKKVKICFTFMRNTSHCFKNTTLALYSKLVLNCFSYLWFYRCSSFLLLSLV